MKYRWITNVITRDSGILTIYCDNKEQAQRNVSHYLDCRIKDKSTISFFSICDSPNVIVMDEIIAVTVCDMDMMIDVHKEDMIEHSSMKRELDYPSDGVE